MHTKRHGRLERKLIATAVAACFAAQTAYANPVGPIVVNGQVIFASRGSLLSITNTPGAIINWRQFSIGASEATRFIQQSAASSVLNRVVGVDPSSILGTLQSNGRVFLINPNGILFGPNARVDVAGLVASTLNLTNDDFLAGRMNFIGDLVRAAPVVNQGSITANAGGSVYLVGSAVDNQGIITAPNGDIVLAAGKSVRVTDSATSGVQVEVTAPADRQLNLSDAMYGNRGIYAGLVRNSGLIAADSVVRGAEGRIILKASSGVQLTTGGTLSANGETGGRVVSDAQQGDAIVSGTISVRGNDGTGGSVAVTGNRVGLLDSALIDASGRTGGGTVLIGGDAHGAAIRDGDGTLGDSRSTYVGPDARILADARGSGDGGKVVVWAEDATQFYGQISARGGATSGNGGFVETSGKGSLDFQGLVDTRAPAGATGTLLLDPTDITISNLANTPTMAFGGGSYTDTTTTPSNLNVTTLTTQLGLGNVTVSTASALAGNGDITVNSPISYSSAFDLNLSANRRVTISAGSGITNTGSGALTLTSSGAGFLSIGESLSTNGGTITLNGGVGLMVANTKSVNAGSGQILINAGGGAVDFGSSTLQTSNPTSNAVVITNISGFALGNVSLTGGGMLNITHSGNGTQFSGTVISGTGGVIKAGSGTLTLSKVNTYGGATTINAGTVIATSDNALGTAAGGTTVASGATLGFSGSINYATAEPVTINGTGDAGNGRAGAIDNVSGTNTFAGPITLGAASTIGAEAGTGTLSANIVGAGNALTFGGAGNITTSGVISGAGTTLTKNGTGTLSLNNVANTFDGAVTLNAGQTNVMALANAGTASSLGTGAATPGITLGSATAAELDYWANSTTTDRVITLGGAGGGRLTNRTFGQTLTLSGNIVGSGFPFTIGNGGSGNVTISGVISGAGTTLTDNAFSVDSLLTLSGVNTYTGATTLTSGTVIISQDANLGTPPLWGPTPGSLAFGGGTLRTTASFTLNANRGIALNAGGGTISTDPGTTLTYGGTIAGANSLTKQGTGTLTLSGNSTYSGTTTVSAGVVDVQSNKALGASNAAAAATSVASGAALQVDGSGLLILKPITLAGTGVAGGGALLNLANNNTWSGAVTLGAGGASINSNGGTLTISGNIGGATQPLTVGGTGNTTISGVIGTTTGSLTKNGTGTLKLSAVNTYTGATNVTGGTLKLGVANAVGASSDVTVAGGATFDLAAFGDTIGSLAGAGTVTNSGGSAATLAAGADNASTMFSGAIQDGANTVALTKQGAGTLTLSGNSSYGGATTISAGTLVASNNNALGATSAGTTIASGATLQIANGIAIGAEALTVSGAGVANNGAVVVTSGSGSIAGAVILGASSSIGGNGSLTLSGAINDVAPGTSTLSQVGSGTLTFANTVGAHNQLAAVATSAGQTTAINGGSVRTTGSQTYGGIVTSSGAAALTSTGGGNITANNTGNSFSGNLSLLTAGSASIVNSTALALGASSVGALTAQTLAGDLTLNGAITASGAGNSIVLASAGNFVNNVGAGALAPGPGNWQVWSSSPAADIRGGLAYNFKQYNTTYGVTPILGTGNGFLYTIAPTITPSLAGTVSKVYDGTTAATLAGSNYSMSGAIDGDTAALNQPAAGTYDTCNVGVNKNVSVSGIAIASATNGAATVYGYQLASTSANANIGTVTTRPITISPQAGQGKTYGDDDPSSAKTAYTVSGGSVAPGDGVVGNMGRIIGETAGSYSFTSGTTTVDDGNGGNNYGVTFNGAINPFQISKAELTGTIASQNKTYGQNDPALAGIAVNLNGVVNRTVADINGNNTVANDTGNVADTLGSLTRAAGENVSSYNIIAATFNGLTGSAAVNYNATAFAGSPTLTIGKASLTGSIANQSKVYGTDDLSLAGIAVSLNGVVNRTVSTWNGNVAVNDTGNVADTLASLTRAAGENVGAYNITAGTFNGLTGSAVGNYNATAFAGAPTLTITPASLTGSIVNQSKVYGTDDPSLVGIAVNLNGVVNRTVSTWSGNLAVNDTGNVTDTLASLTRAAGETVGSYAISSGTFNGLTGSASGNYNAPTFTGTPTLTIGKATLTGSIANQSKPYGQDDPALGGISVNLGGVVINPAVVTWNGNVPVNDTGNVADSLVSLTRAAGENVGSYNISAANFTGLTGAAAGNYNATAFAGSPTLTIGKANLTGAIVNQSKTYGQDDPALGGVGVNLGGVVNRTVSTWNGNVAVDDTGNVSDTLASLTRTAGENVGGYNITGATFNGLTGSAVGNYNATAFAGSPTLTIGKANLTGSIANQSKTYGADDPLLGGIAVNLGGVVNRAISTWNGNVAVNDTGDVADSLASLSRVAGENVSSYNITAATFNGLTGSAAGNYNATAFAGAPTLTITPASLTGSIVNQSKVYGTDDPSLAGIAVNLNGVVNRTVSTWNGNVAVNDTGNVADSLASLTRAAGENVGSHNITAATFNGLTGSASGNYNAPTFAGVPTLTIRKANLTGTIVNQSKTYGQDDPALGGVGVNLGGVVNRTVSSWSGNVAVNDTGNIADSLASLTRAAGETVGSYAISSGTFNELTGSASGNYNATVFAGSPTLTIGKANLTGTLATDPLKTYGASDPSGLPVALGGQINASVTDWNGVVTAINDTLPGRLTAAASSLNRTAGETVGSYNITSGTVSLGGSAAGNYAGANFVAAGSRFNIVRAPLTVNADDKSRPQGAENPPFTATYSGLVFGETPAVMAGALQFDTHALPASPEGRYPIIPFGQTSANYVIVFVNGTLSILSQSIGLAPVPEQLAALQSLGLGSSGHEFLNCLCEGNASIGAAMTPLAVSALTRCVDRIGLTASPPAKRSTERPAGPISAASPATISE